MKDLYYILGVGKQAGPAEIDNAYRILSEKLKPTGNGDQFLQNHFNEITDAYAILSNPSKRKTYDAALKRGHLRQLSRFKAKTANIFIAAAVLFIAGLVGFYLVDLINSHKAPKKVFMVDSAVAVQPVKKHHKHKHRLIAHNKPIVNPVKPTAKVIEKPMVAAARPATLPASLNNGLAKKPLSIAVVKPLAVKKDSVVKLKPPIAIADKHLVLVKSTIQRDSTYITYLKNNLRDSVYMHQLADYMSPVVSVLASNAKVRVLEKGHNFYKVAFSRQTGYIPKWALVKP